MRGRDEGEMEGGIFSTASSALNHVGVWGVGGERDRAKEEVKGGTGIKGKTTFTAAFVYLYSLVAESMGILIEESGGLEGLSHVASAGQ